MVTCLLLFFCAANTYAITGPHGDERIKSPKGVCATCHIPHKSKGPKIWARTSKKPGLYDGIHQLCATCHDGTMFFKGDAVSGGEVFMVDGYQPGNYPPANEYEGIFTVDTGPDGEREVYASTGTDDVMDEMEGGSSTDGPFENHVMHGGADVGLDDALIFFDSEVFPLDPTDSDTYPQGPAPDRYRSGGAGVYCGTCHDPHKQPDSRDSGGFYLRTRPGHGVGDPWNNRKPFCAQCHGEIHAPESDCLACHHPHLGRTLIKDNETLGRKIFRFPVEEKPFIATPNVLSVNDTGDDEWSGALCYGCHNGIQGNLWTQAGAVPIYGEDITDDSREHHPMGTQAWLGDSSKVNNGMFIRAPGTPAEFLNKNGGLTCTSCHDGFHGPGPYTGTGAKGKNKRNNFLRWNFASPDGADDPQSTDPSEDSADFCIACHSDKSASMLGGRHLHTRAEAYARNVTRLTFMADPNGSVTQTEVGCANCMFCHFIHDGTERQKTSTGESLETLVIRPDVDSLMRIAPLNLAWGEHIDNTDPLDYEDLCYGCHGDQAIVGELGAGSLLRPEEYYTHPFTVEPQIIIDPNSFPVSDGGENGVPDDYGTQQGEIFCGTCHDVHTGSNRPYLRSQRSPYEANGFCEGCHDQDGFLSTSHPIDRGPNFDPRNGPVTAETFEDTLWGYGPVFSSGGSGKPGGITDPYDAAQSTSLLGTKGKVICLTCHNTHAARTSRRGEVSGDSSMVHGKLLVMDNFPTNSTEPGDELCRACHDRNVFPLNGPHRDDLAAYDERGICHNCHVPHRAQSESKLWAIDLPGTFDGVHDMCNSCHNPLDFSTVSGQGDVFSKGSYENHVMFGGAVITTGECPEAPSLRLVGDLDTAIFPLDPNDSDTIPEKDDGSYCNRSLFSYREGGEGFYCGTCHNPHNDLSEDPNGYGDYLRAKDSSWIGEAGKRKPFCIQCHGEIHAPGSDCLDCHHPHQGKTLIEDDERIGRLILSQFSVVSTTFTALPNVPEITDDPNDTNPSQFCYACHNPDAGGSAGIPVIYGDDAGDMRREHHPMGTQASLTDPEKVKDGVFIRAPGTPPQFLNNNKQLTCTSCHDGLHGLGPFAGLVEREKSKANAFLRWVLNDGEDRDKPDFCLACHSDKAPFTHEGRHMVSPAESPNGRGGCMFCHFVHDGDERQTDPVPGIGIRTDLDALMRVPSLNLVWGDRHEDTDIFDYEDLCFGCHGTQAIVGGTGGAGAMIDPNTHFTHPFTLVPDADIIGDGFPIADGAAMVVQDDYGTEDGHMYCGTCHDVHDNRTAPYLGTHPSPYQTKGLCEACHDADSQFVPASHPIGVGPNPDPSQGAPTAPAFADSYHGGGPLFSQGGSGRPGGITYPFNTATGQSTLAGKGAVICLTCHNTHAAATSWQGENTTDPYQDHGYLLVKDNLSERGTHSPGSELCKACHPFGDTEYDFPSGDHGGGGLSGAEWGICNACHTPHGAAGPKLWSRPGYGSGPFQGFRQLCFTCHNLAGIAKTGAESVFKKALPGGQIPGDYLEDHVMRNWADIDGVAYYDPNTFPRDSSDHDAIPTGPKPQPDPHDGFYCGSCHNPHLQQGDAYLRSRGGNAGYPGKREDFCNDCHIDAHFQEQDDACLLCHNPHQGRTQIDEDPNVGRLILIVDFRARTFTAEPNVDGFTGDDVSSTCYGCHGPSESDPNVISWEDLGATCIYGDDAATVEDADSQARRRGKTLTYPPRDHHPMGRQARFGQCPRAPGADRSLFNKNGELTCTSCHSDTHQGDRENNFLRWDFAKDNSHFCLRCHPNKLETKLGPLGGGHHQTWETSPVTRVVRTLATQNGKKTVTPITVKCANCMFCHFIHDGEDQGDTSTPGVKTLMRISPVNLRWGDAWQDEDTLDYEDLCYGCHSRERIVGGVGSLGALIIPPQELGPEAAADPILGRRFTHRFRCEPNPASPTSIRLKSANPVFPLSDGTGEMVPDDYGTESGRLYCGTCHDVHTWAANPGSKYLRGLTSPYAPGGGFCHECHSADPAPSVCTPAFNHRLAPAPEGIISVVEWSPLLFSNVDPGMARGKGEKGGYIAAPTGLSPSVGQMTCLTCHNIHAAETTYDGQVTGPQSDESVLVDGRHGKLLVIDNGHGPAGSDLCINCHPDHSQIVGSAHDFSHRGLDGLGGGIATKGICSACHSPHLAPGEKLLWVRSMAEERLTFGAAPGFALGSTIYCYDCHSGIVCDANPPPELFLPFPPQDVAFVDGPGGLIAGYYENLPAYVQDIPPHRLPSGMPTEIKTSGHFVRQPILTPGISQNDKLACNDCHNPHRGITKEGIANQAFIKAILGGKPMGPYKASINMAYHPETRDNLESRQACVACHGLSERVNAPIYAPTTFANVNPLYTSGLLLARPPKTVYEHFDAGIYACTDCHRHNRAMVLCIDCHGYPPTSVGNGWMGSGDTDQNYKGGAGAHYTHVVEHQFACTMCHKGCLHDPGGATVVNPSFKRAKVSIDFDTSYAFPRSSGEFQTKMAYYGTDGKAIIPPIYDPIKQTCYVGCHNPLVGDPDDIPNLNNPTPAWSLQAAQAPTAPTYPGGSSTPTWITVRIPYVIPGVLPGTWQIPGL
ncbi:MAG: cytochrome c3 family protein [bacterium]